MKKLLVTSSLLLMILAGCRDSDVNQQDGEEHEIEDPTEEVGPKDNAN